MLCSLAASAQNIADIFKSNTSLSQLFAHPFGIENAINETTPQEVEDCLTKKGMKFEKSDLGDFGIVFNVTPNNLEIGGVLIGQMTLNIGKASASIIYITKPSDDYQKFGAYLGDELQHYSKLTETVPTQGNESKIFVLNDNYGIIVGNNVENKTGMAILLDIKNFSTFLGLNRQSAAQK